MSIYLSEVKNNEEIWLFKRDKTGKKSVEKVTDFKPYFYVPEDEDVSGLTGILKVERGFKDLFDNPLKKVYVSNTKLIPLLREIVTKSYESDILFNTRYLIDLEKDIEEGQIKSYSIDIETASHKTFPDVDEADQEITIISITDSVTDETTTWVWREDFELDISGNVKKFSTEKGMLIDFINWLKETSPDLITGWNCVSEHSYIWMNNGLKKIKHISNGEKTYKNGLIKNKSKSKKTGYDFGSNFGSIICSKSHKFGTVKSPYKYTSLKKLKSIPIKFKRVEEIEDDFLIYEYDRNKNKDLPDFQDDLLYLSGILYSDGTYGKDNRVHIYNNNKQIIKKLETYYKKYELNRYEIYCDRRVKPTYRISFSKQDLNDYFTLIYKEEKRELNIERLSLLSPKQFSIFLAGLIDGDVYKNRILIKKKTSEDERNGFQQLLLYNGIITTRSENEYNIHSIENETVRETLLENTVNKYKVEKNFVSTKKNRTTNLSKFFIDRENKQIYAKTTKKKCLKKKLNMMDIETEEHAFFSPMLTHNCVNFDLKYFFNRCKVLGIDYRKISPMNEIYMRDFNGNTDITIKGIIILDGLRAYKHFRKLSNMGEIRSYSLDNVAKEELNEKKIEHKETYYEMWKENIDKLIEYNRKDSKLALKILLKHTIIDFFDSIRRKSHCQLIDVFQTGKVVDCYLLHNSHNRVVFPNKPRTDGKIIKSDQIKGAFVLEPKYGVYRNVLVLDLKGLYPSIMRTFNISLETLRKDSKEDNLIDADEGVKYLNKKGLVPQVLEELIEERGRLKKLAKKYYDEGNELLGKNYDHQQYAVKVIANCFTGDHNVLTEKGLKNIKDVKNGELVYSIDKNNNVCLRKAQLFEGETNKLYHLKTSSIDVTTTGNHKWITVKNDKRKIMTSEDIFRSVDKIKLIEHNKSPLLKDIKTNVTFCGEDDESYVSYETRPVYCLNVEDTQTFLIERNGHYAWTHNTLYGVCLFNNSRLFNVTNGATITRLAREIIKWSISVVKKHEYEVRYGDSVCKDSEIIIKENGNVRYEKIKNIFKNTTKTIGTKQYDDSLDIQTLTIDSDGKSVFKPIKYVMRHKTKKKIYRIFFTNNWYIDVTEDHSLIGYLNTTHKKTKNINERLVEVKPSEIGKKVKTIISLKKIPDMKVESKNNTKIPLIKDYKSTRRKKSLNENDFDLKKVVKIEEIEYEDYVYDIEVEDTHRFFANNVLVHNTDSIYVQSKHSSFLNILKDGQYIRKLINDSYKDFIKNRNIKKHYLDMEFESALRSIIFIPKLSGVGAKKLYAYKELWVDGKKASSNLKMKGISAKRSDSSELTRTTQIKVLNMVLEGATREEVVKFLEEIKNDIENGSITPEQLGIPKGITKNLDEYCPPMAVHKGAIYSNKYFNTQYGKGTKLKYVYISKVPDGYPEEMSIIFRKNGEQITKTYPVESISFEDKIPPGFEIDKERMIETTIRAKIEPIFVSMGWDWFYKNKKEKRKREREEKKRQKEYEKALKKKLQKKLGDY